VTRRGKQFNNIIKADLDPLTGARPARYSDGRRGRPETRRERRRPVAGPLAGGQCFDSRPGLDSAGRLDASGVPDYNAIVQVLPAPA